MKQKTVIMDVWTCIQNEQCVLSKYFPEYKKRN